MMVPTSGAPRTTAERVRASVVRYSFPGSALRRQLLIVGIEWPKWRLQARSAPRLQPHAQTTRTSLRNETCAAHPPRGSQLAQFGSAVADPAGRLRLGTFDAGSECDLDTLDDALSGMPCEATRLESRDIQCHSPKVLERFRCRDCLGVLGVALSCSTKPTLAR